MAKKSLPSDMGNFLGLFFFFLANKGVSKRFKCVKVVVPQHTCPLTFKGCSTDAFNSFGKDCYQVLSTALPEVLMLASSALSASSMGPACRTPGRGGGGGVACLAAEGGNGP